MNHRPDRDRPREPWDERPDWPHEQWDEVPDEPPMPWDERPPWRGLGRPRRSPWAEREWETPTDLLRNQLARVLSGGRQPRTKNPDAGSRQPRPGQAD
jgi:hypothetical protein